MIRVFPPISGAISLTPSVWLGALRQQNDVGAFHRFAIVVGDDDTEFLGARRAFRRMLHLAVTRFAQKQALLQVRPQLDATEFASAEYGQSFVRKFEGHVNGCVTASGLPIVSEASTVPRAAWL